MLSKRNPLTHVNLSMGSQRGKVLHLDGSRERNKLRYIGCQVIAISLKEWSLEVISGEGMLRWAQTCLHFLKLDPHATILKIANSSEKGSLPTFAMLFRREILEAPRLRKVKMPSIELFDGTTNPDDHLDLYKAQMYVHTCMMRRVVSISQLP